MVDPGHGDVHVAVSSGSGFTYQTWAISDGISAGASWVPADVNGDGKIDLLQRTIGTGCKIMGLVSTGSGFTRKLWPTSTCPNPTEAQFLVGDFNSLPRRRPGATGRPTSSP